MKAPMQRRHFLYLLIAMLALPPLAITGKLVGREANAQQIGGGSAASAPSNVRDTRHNLSSSAKNRNVTSDGPTTEAVVKAGTGTGLGTPNEEVCVYCHTPHGATQPNTPLWNRALIGQNYTPYSSSSLQATDIDVTAAGLTGSPSKLCLSCHDGTLALGAVANAPGSGTGSAIALTNTDAGAGASATGKMPFGRGQLNADHGFTRRLGTDLRNDHPISFTYDTGLATADGELRPPAGVSAGPDGRPLIGDRVAGQPKPHFPLTGGKVHCTTCHDPHKETQKFLNTNRLARVAPDTAQSSYTDWSFKPNDDQMCLGCHTRLGKAWAVSAHSQSTVAEETYNAGDAAVRDFPTGTKVWQAGCLNCHDTHTAGGSRRLLREGVDGGTGTVNISGLGYAATIRKGITSLDDYSATSALENTCYQCHSGSPVITPTALSASEGVPNIAAEFARTYRMPLTNSDQGDTFVGNTSEVHDITDKDTIESRTQLGYFAPENRHVECTDCHNPHRVVKADTILGSNLLASVEGPAGVTNQRTHTPARGTKGNQGNIASGALRGTWGVEPSYTATGQTTVTMGTNWMSTSENPTFTVKKGDPAGASALPTGTVQTNSISYLTREYQLCFKCHSNYANGPLATDFIQLKTGARGGTPPNTNGMTRYTDVAKEFAVRATDPPSSGNDQGEYGECGGNCVEDGTAIQPNGSLPADTGNNPDDPGTQNHRSWHPVVFPTGRTADERRISSATGNFRVPFRAKLGTQTMHCSDCHGHDGTWTQDTGPNLTTVQGPHGSSNPFLLRGTWSTATTLSSNGLCGNCHEPTAGTQGVGDNGTGRSSGFNADSAEGAGGHGNAHGGAPCMRCHVAVPHGWKNKALLVNLNCVGPEGGLSGTCNSINNGSPDAYSAYNNPPYYNGAYLRVKTWQASGNWSVASCGYSGGTGGKAWMKDDAGCDGW